MRIAELQIIMLEFPCLVRKNANSDNSSEWLNKARYTTAQGEGIEFNTVEKTR
jgi:hypothetical protein